MTKIMLAIVLLLATLAPAGAGWTCKTYGDTVRCTDDDGETTTCRRYGDSVRCD
jgi:hypothetical protein